MNKEQLSVGNNIKALALINIEDIFRFTITATDEEIKERYGSEDEAVRVAEMYLEIALKAGMLEHALAGWNMNYTMPIKDSDERADYTAYFYNKYKEAEEAPTEPAPKPAEAPAKPVSDVVPTTGSTQAESDRKTAYTARDHRQDCRANERVQDHKRDCGRSRRIRSDRQQVPAGGDGL